MRRGIGRRWGAVEGNSVEGNTVEGNIVEGNVIDANAVLFIVRRRKSRPSVIAGSAGSHGKPRQSQHGQRR
jgi:hypothetical protein